MAIGRLLVHAIGAATLAFSSLASTAQAYPKNCNDVMLQGYTTDGEYTIEPSVGIVFSVYCKDLAWGVSAPKDYLTLVKTGVDPVTGVESNFSTISVGGAWSGSTVKTSFTKIRIDPNNLIVDIGDLTFATSTGALTPNGGGSVTAVPYAVAGDCAGVGTGTGVANIDLTDLPFEVKSVFATEGYNPAGSANGTALTPNTLTQLVQAKVVNLTGGGYCGATGPDGFSSSVIYWLYSQGGTTMPALKLRYRT